MKTGGLVLAAKVMQNSMIPLVNDSCCCGCAKFNMEDLLVLLTNNVNKFRQ